MRFIRNASPEVKAALIIAIGGIIGYVIYATLPIILRPPVPGNTPTPTATAFSSPTPVSTATPTVIQSTILLLCNNPTGTGWRRITQAAICSNRELLMQQLNEHADFAQVNLTNVNGTLLNFTLFHAQVQATFMGNSSDSMFGNTVAAFYLQIPQTSNNIVGYVFELYPNSNNTDTFTGPAWDIENINLKGINTDGTTLVKHGPVATGTSKVITTAMMALTVKGQEVTFYINGTKETTFLLDSTPTAFGLVVGRQHQGGASSEVQFSQFALS